MASKSYTEYGELLKDYVTVRRNLSLPYHWALGPVWSRFFDGLTENKIYGSKCNICSKILVPARSFCPYCFKDIEEWVEVAQEGIIETFCIVNYHFYGQVKEPPYIIAQIRLDGVDCGFYHYIGGFQPFDLRKLNEKIKVGSRVKAVWREEKKGDINDIAFFSLLNNK